MKNISVVLGSNYGDEGKGRTTFALGMHSNFKTAVVRFNGGAQAGHTVKFNTIRHVFSHFGSGTLLRIPTILTSEFVCNPYLFLKEYDELTKQLICPEVIASFESQVSTPWDGFINRAIETKRGKNRHGSVGVGFGEAVHRAENGYLLTVYDIINKNSFDLIVNRIVEEYIPQRCAELGIDINDPEFGSALLKDKEHFVREKFYQECQDFLEKVYVREERLTISNFEHLIFEGAQGLLLDQNGEDFPHVTRSNTGVDNVLRFVSEHHINAPIHMFYASRPYVTRHGAGPLKHESLNGEIHQLYKIIDETNRPHEYQGSLRFGLLDIDTLKLRVMNDFNKIPAAFRGSLNLSWCCFDQAVNDLITYIHNGEIRKVDSGSFSEAMKYLFNAQYSIIAKSEEATNITVI